MYPFRVCAERRTIPAFRTLGILAATATAVDLYGLSASAGPASIQIPRSQRRIEVPLFTTVPCS